MNDEQRALSISNELADHIFYEKIESAQQSFGELCDLYRSYVSKSETPQERFRRIQVFRCGGRL